MSRSLFSLFAVCSLLLVNSVQGGALLHSEADSANGNMLLLSDIHLDPFADPNLVKQLIAAPAEQWEKIFSSVPNEPFAPYGKDSNYALMVSALSAAKDKGPYDFAIVTGDYLVHDSRKLFEPFGGKDELAYENFVTKTEVFVAREVQEYLAGTPVYLSLGNNDSECGDYMMATHTKFLDVFAHELAVLKPYPAAKKTMADAGYYMVPHSTLAKTRFVVLNDIYWSNHYEADSCYSQPNDRAGDQEMDWLKAQLGAAKGKGEKVVLVMHIPPQVDIFSTLKSITTDKKKKEGKFFWDKKYEKGFVDLMRSYSDTVEFCYAGHTHMDDFRVLADNQGKPFLVTHLCPALSPIRMNNPGFQVMDYNRTTGAIQNMQTFYLKNLSVAKGGNGQWGLEYDFDATYGVNGYNADSLTALTQTLDLDLAKLALFSKYYIVSASPIITTDSWKKLNDLRLLADEKELKAALKNN